jgi:hypothetical protein
MDMTEAPVPLSMYMEIVDQKATLQQRVNDYDIVLSALRARINKLERLLRLLVAANDTIGDNPEFSSLAADIAKDARDLLKYDMETSK